MKAAIVSIGTELTDGQILNSNATWISKELKSRGLTVTCHLAVPDDFSLMLQALRYADLGADLLFVTGGLGPTSDDFTRDVIAKWCNRDLVLHEPSWENLKTFFASLGREPHDIQKQQCYFPQDAEILLNRKGTANGFKIQVNQNTVYVLPGPPLEIQAIWQDHISSQLDKMTAQLDPLVTQSWDLLEVSEPDAAIATENTVKSPLASKGYRVHLPYVEVKITYLKSHEKALEAEMTQLDQNLKKYTVSRNGEDIAGHLLTKLQKQNSVHICDTLTQGKLAQRLGMAFFSQQAGRSLSNHPGATEAEVLLEILPAKSGHYQFRISRDGQTDQKTIELTHIRQERQILVALEHALIFWFNNL